MAMQSTRDARTLTPVVVELVGAPGAGKTTFLPAALDACRTAGLRPYTIVGAGRAFAARTLAGRAANAVLPARLRDKALWAIFLGCRSIWAAAFAARRPQLAWYVLALAQDRPAAARARERRVLHWYVRLVGAYGFLTSRAREGEALVLDEGFIHRTVQLHSSTVEIPEAATIDAYVDLVPRPELLVHVRAPIDVCERRVRSRGVWDRFRSEDPSDLTRFVANAHRATTLIATAAEARGWRVVEIDNGEGDPAHVEAALRSRIRAALEEHARSGAGG
jgi:hypothetical protein